MTNIQTAYADYVCSPDDYRSGLTDSLLFDDD